MVFQSYALYPHMDVRKNMTFGLKFTGVAPAERERRVAEAARMLRLEQLLERYPRDLSGGQRQRVAIGRAIVREPDVFLFDEPLSNLDAALRVSTRVEIARLHRLLGATIVYVTHDQIEAMTLADRIVVMNQGRIEQVGKPLDLYYAPANLFVAGFIGSPAMNFFPATVERVDGGTARGERRVDRAADAAGRRADGRRRADDRRPAGAPGAGGDRRFRRHRRRRTGRAAGRGLLRPCPARRRQADGGRDPWPRDAFARTDRHLLRAPAEDIHVFDDAGRSLSVADQNFVISSRPRVLCSGCNNLTQIADYRTRRRVRSIARRRRSAIIQDGTRRGLAELTGGRRRVCASSG